MRYKNFFLTFIAICLFAGNAIAQPPVEDRVAVLITGWCMPAGYNFDYAWTTSDYPRIGDKNEFEGQPCKIGHLGEFPYQSHISMIPWAITFLTPGYELYFDYHGIYTYNETLDVYEHPNPAVPDVNAADIPAGTPITPLVQVLRGGVPEYPPDPRTGEDLLAGWYRIGSFQVPYANGVHDLVEAGPALYVRYYGIMGVPEGTTDPSEPPPAIKAQDEHLELLMTNAFGDNIDMRYGCYTAMPGYTKLHDDVAEEFATEGYRKLLIARETTDHNRYANEFLSGNFAKERLCELGVLDDTEIYQSRQVGRTPEFNSMNVVNLKSYIEAYPEGSTIGIIYVTRGLTWYKEETTGPFGSAHPWSKEVYHDNAYLNYLSWKKALQAAYGDRYNLVFTKDGVETDLREENFFTYGLATDIDLKGYGGATVFYSIRDAIELAIADGLEQIIVAPCHWNYDSLDTIFRMQEYNALPVAPKAQLEAGNFAYTHCEDASGNVVDCASVNSVIEIVVAPSYSNVPEEFATAYYVVLRGALERFGLSPAGEAPSIEVSQLVTKLAGGTVEVTAPASPIKGAKIQIPADPYPTRPEGFTPATAIPVNDPDDTNDCMWEDTVMTLGYRSTPPAMNVTQPVGPAVACGPYRTFFNRNVTITIPYDSGLAGSQPVRVGMYNHVTEDWNAIVPDSVDTVNSTVTFSTQVLGLFQASVGDRDADGIADASDNCVEKSNPAQRDTYPPAGNGIGNLCDCEGNFNCDTDQDVDGSDAAIFKADFSRGGFIRPCTGGDRCNGDFSCDGDVDGTDAAMFKQDFSRSTMNNPCPSCAPGMQWCQY